MRLIVLNKLRGGRIALLPTGQLVLSEVLQHKQRDGEVVGPSTRILVQGQALLVDSPFEQLVENINAEVEGWRA